MTTWRPCSHLWRRCRPGDGCRGWPTLSETPNRCELLQCEGGSTTAGGPTSPSRAGPAGPSAPRLRVVSPSPSRHVPHGPGRSESLCVSPSQRRPHGPDRSEAPRGSVYLEVTGAPSDPCPCGAEPAPAVTKPLGGVRGVMCDAHMTGLKNQTRQLCDDSKASKVRNNASRRREHCPPFFSVEPFAGIFERSISSDGRPRFGWCRTEVRPSCLLQAPNARLLTWKSPGFAADKTIRELAQGLPLKARRICDHQLGTQTD